MQAVFFISDLHLQPRNCIQNEYLDEFIESVFSTSGNTLYILGDYFDFWIGDDAAQRLGYGRQLRTIKRLTEKHNTVNFMRGNRDFLVGTAFSEITGARLLDDPAKIELTGKTCLLKHGDDLCTDDVEHQRFRVMTRDQQWQDAVLSKSVDERLELASQMRQMSGSNYKPTEIMDVNEQCVKEIFAEQPVDVLIHGHTHRPAVHNYLINDRARQRIVLGDWHKGISYLKVDDNGFQLVHP